MSHLFQVSSFSSLGNNRFPWIVKFLSTLFMGIQAKYSSNLNKFGAALNRRQFKWTASLPTTMYSNNTFISNQSKNLWINYTQSIQHIQ